MIVSIFIMSFDAALTQTTKVYKYERVLRITNYPENELIKHFPKKIPENAKDIIFQFHPAILQGGEVHRLKFETDSLAIDNYINEFTKDAIWIGKFDEAIETNYAIYSETFGYFGYNPLPEDYTIYLFASENTNHGKLSLAAISPTNNTIIFIADNW